jgi:hypothetical protein
MTLIAPSVDLPRRNKGHRKRKTVAIDGYEDERAQAVFVFKYRSLGKSKTFDEQNHANWYALEILQAIGVVPTIPRTVGGRTQPSIAPVAIPIRQSREPREVPGANREIITASAAANAATGDLEGLTEEDVIALITHHLAYGQGLHGQARARLMILPEYYEVSSI